MRCEIWVVGLRACLVSFELFDDIYIYIWDSNMRMKGYGRNEIEPQQWQWQCWVP